MARLHGTMIQIDGFEAYLSKPRPGVPVRGGVLVIHEIWGLADHIKDVADRFAAEGYVTLAPDILTHAGIDPVAGAEIQRLLFGGDEAARSKAQPLLRELTAPTKDAAYAAWALDALHRAVDRLVSEDAVEAVGVVGFCFGGTYAYALAATEPRLAAAVPFYGEPPRSTDYSGFACPVLAFYGGTDARLIDGLPGVTEAMTRAGVDYAARVYPHAGHAFFNDTNSHTYRPEDAADAWRRTLAFLGERIPGQGGQHDRGLQAPETMQK